MKIPTRKECIQILKDANVPDKVIAHTIAVSEFSMKVVDIAERNGIQVNRDLVRAGCLLHDIRKVSSKRHEIDGAEYVKSLGFPEVASLVRKHGLSNLAHDELVPTTFEEKIVFYADKRVNGDQVVSLKERFDDIQKRYGHPKIEAEFMIAKQIEKELLGEKF